jgi:SAM-dependent methyltransferase
VNVGFSVYGSADSKLFGATSLANSPDGQGLIFDAAYLPFSKGGPSLWPWANLKPITERLLREAGVAPGMRVLDLGCGTGDVALLAAELVGPNGAVVGIDRNDDVLAVACDRARAAGYANIEFREGAAEDFVDPVPFDLAIGRYVLVHQADPTTFIRSAASHVRPDGLIVFHELAVYGECHALPPVPLWEQCWNWAIIAFRSVMAHPDAAGRMTAYFHDARLKRPTIFCEIPVGGGPDSPLCSWLARSVRSVLPQLGRRNKAA